MDIYLCTHHNRRPDEYPKTHIIYHEALHPFVLDQIRLLERSMKRRKVNSPICRYVDIQELTTEILNNKTVIRIQIGLTNYPVKPGKQYYYLPLLIIIVVTLA